ncbi:MAG: N-acetylneuraminate synthase [Eubacterium sp.]|nr:N-acetylneuraminate synthase [Eubacterium sp.]
MYTYIIAEAGVNHNGSEELAMKMIDIAKKCGADCIKFQTFKSENLTTSSADMADYQKNNTGKSDSQLNMLKKLELSYDEFKLLFEHCRKVGIDFLSTPFDLESARFLKNMGMKCWKIPSGEITNRPLLEYIGRQKQEVILSTGMSDIQEVKMALDVIRAGGTEDITLLHCTSQYPADYDTVNLNAMLTLKNTFGCKVGYSDHTKGLEVATAAAALGANVIEKHFTLDKNMEGPDHKASIEPEELRNLVNAVRHIELAMGDGEKKVFDVEKKNRELVRKSIVAAVFIPKGTIIQADMLTTKRPGTGISPMRIKEVVGCVAERDYQIDDMICL